MEQVTRATIFARARENRKRMTPSEARLWTHLKERQLDGLKFRRQHPFGPYILDFYCCEVRTAVEVDGTSHDSEERAAAGQRREAYLKRHGVRVLHVPAHALEDQATRVVDWIGRCCLR